TENTFAHANTFAMPVKSLRGMIKYIKTRRRRFTPITDSQEEVGVLPQRRSCTTTAVNTIIAIITTIMAINAIIRSRSIQEHVDIGVTSLPLLRSRLGGDSRLR